ncbi:Retrovirus-related Pol polyprotein from transposon TNT 1-94 [Gossypium australe]|uniref:Retrovirus-related Pol polyprotein from transposon TNT 1-94 n=1 Tax=Gossypium australe TaxID=47621 RepID=A0A5B6VVJ0_9ROSI|nr:Retrovirus-related Pol polyprotein from transposon TNT 1-94 [Gossypium australe]
MCYYVCVFWTYTSTGPTSKSVVFGSPNAPIHSARPALHNEIFAGPFVSLPHAFPELSIWYPSFGATNHTQEILLRGHTHEGLYRFSLVTSSVNMGFVRGVDIKWLKHGIVHHATCPHTSEQNGIVERKHRHIVSHHKGYQCLASNGRVFISRYLVFDDDHFLFASLSTPSDSPASDQVTTVLPIIRSSSPNLPSSDTASLIPTSVFSSDPISIMSDPVLTRDTNNASSCGHICIFKSNVLTVELFDHEPRNIDEAFASIEWRKADEDDYDDLLHNNTWTLVPLPLGRKVIG